jgi:hypothetical protein
MSCRPGRGELQSRWHDGGRSTAPTRRDAWQGTRLLLTLVADGLRDVMGREKHRRGGR